MLKIDSKWYQHSQLDPSIQQEITPIKHCMYDL